MSDDNYDVIVIGGGPGGYVAAIRAAQNGLKAACIDNWQDRENKHAFGGTCLNAGCIPSKAMLEASELYERTGHEFGDFGIKVEKYALDLATMQKRRAAIVKQHTGGIAQLFQGNKVTGLAGTGKLGKGGKVSFEGFDGKKQTLEAKNVILAAGSVPVELKSLPFDHETIVDSWDALEFDRVPKRLGVIGAGVIGLEMGSIWRRLGSEVVILEALEEFLPMVDEQVAKEAQKQFKKQGLDIRLGTKVTGAKKSKSGVTLSYETKDGKQTLEVDKVLVAVGRRPFAEGLLEKDAGVAVDERGFIKVDEECRTNVKGVWAIGDVVRGPMLAHKASEEGVMAADLIAGKVAEVNYEAVPSVIYTAPEVAWVGKSAQQLKKDGVPVKTGRFPFVANGRANALGMPAGMVKMIAHQQTDEILGVHIVGPYASELIAEAVLAMEYRASAEDIQRTMHAHPTLSEAMHEAALAVDKRAIHVVNRR
ncbi:MAG TPA: dihydrolipoyl dehydrogenase [Gammaproteobacteria bacterium]|nr:dihydrolipoyl dehydrogenase [Gammaproteobacteria bacterium]